MGNAILVKCSTTSHSKNKTPEENHVEKEKSRKLSLPYATKAGRTTEIKLK